MSDYDQEMIEKYQNLIEDDALTILFDSDLRSLNFIRELKLNELELNECTNIIPKLKNQKQQTVISIQDFLLENVEVLAIYNIYDTLESKVLSQEISQFLKLKKLILYRWKIDVIPLSKMTGLTSLFLQKCDLHSTAALIHLVNLEELCLDFSKVDFTSIQYLTKLTKLSLESCGPVNLDVLKLLVNLEQLDISCNEVDITPLQYLTKITKLKLASCKLISLDALSPLKNLIKLNIQDNNVVYISPIKDLTQLSELLARYNNIIDSESIQTHSNLERFDLNDQKLPTQEELIDANNLCDINSPISSLKLMLSLSNNIKSQNNIFKMKMTKCLEIQHQTHQQFIAGITFLLQQMNESCQ
ncbi:DUF2252_family protein [Hexamita inflata]|uniref:DUF2252 family protein n=1 Tax=Hexamita inflata TaxID=28002 RepID=A0AA86THA8_9EUKA|nr:DUF2252 family protein [Hexamita inflata]